MSPPKPAKAPPRPSPAPRRVSGTRAAVRTPRPPRPPPVAVVFLADEFVEDEADEFLSEEFVVEDAASEAAVGFAGPSDPPPGAHAPLQPETPPPEPPRTTPAVARAPARIPRWISTAAAAAFGFIAVALMLRARAPAVDPARSSAEHPPSVGLPPSESAPVQPVPGDPLASASARQPAPAAAIDTPATATAPAPAAPDTAPALEAKVAAQRALEHGQVSQAITLGERSVELDPTDAESWLILGAAYLQRGSFKDARRCFSSCVKDATHGARRECAALLR
jgi:hypothetical protein